MNIEELNAKLPNHNIKIEDGYLTINHDHIKDIFMYKISVEEANNLTSSEIVNRYFNALQPLMIRIGQYGLLIQQLFIGMPK